MPESRKRRGPRPKESFDPRQPFTRAEAVQAGIAANALRTRHYQRLAYNLYVSAEVAATPKLLACAPLALADPVAWASHASAGRIHGVPLPALPGEHISVVEPGQRLRRAGLTSHVAPRESLVVRVDGHRVSSPMQTFAELGEQLNLVDLVVVGDHFARKGAFLPGELVDFCRASPHPGARTALAAARFVRERVDSPMETRLRMLIVLAGIPEPAVNLTIADVHGLPVRRYDLSWLEVRVIVEYDGRHHVEREQQWERDLQRREAIDDEGHRMLVVTSKGVYAEPGRTLERIQRVLLARGLTGVPLRLKDDWRRHFPGRSDAA